MRNEFTKPVMSIYLFVSEEVLTTSSFQGTSAGDGSGIDSSQYATKSASYDYANNVLSFN